MKDRLRYIMIFVLLLASIAGVLDHRSKTGISSDEEIIAGILKKIITIN
jgi:hypothetical protein